MPSITSSQFSANLSINTFPLIGLGFNLKMSTNPTQKEVYRSEIKKRSEEELLEEEIRNQQTLDSFVESDKNWS